MPYPISSHFVNVGAGTTVEGNAPIGRSGKSAAIHNIQPGSGEVIRGVNSSRPINAVTIPCKPGLLKSIVTFFGEAYKAISKFFEERRNLSIAKNVLSEAQRKLDAAKPESAQAKEAFTTAAEALGKISTEYHRAKQAIDSAQQTYNGAQQQLATVDADLSAAIAAVGRGDTEGIAEMTKLADDKHTAQQVVEEAESTVKYLADVLAQLKHGLYAAEVHYQDAAASLANYDTIEGAFDGAEDIHDRTEADIRSNNNPEAMRMYLERATERFQRATGRAERAHARLQHAVRLKMGNVESLVTAAAAATADVENYRRRVVEIASPLAV